MQGGSVVLAQLGNRRAHVRKKNVHLEMVETLTFLHLRH